jgi:hypothetical protein
MACWANISFSEVQFPLLEIEREPGSGPQVLKAAAQPVSWPLLVKLPASVQFLYLSPHLSLGMPSCFFKPRAHEPKCYIINEADQELGQAGHNEDRPGPVLSQVAGQPAHGKLALEEIQLNYLCWNPTVGSIWSLSCNVLRAHTLRAECCSEATKLEAQQTEISSQ